MSTFNAVRIFLNDFRVVVHLGGLRLKGWALKWVFTVEGFRKLQNFRIRVHDRTRMYSNSGYNTEFINLSPVPNPTLTHHLFYLNCSYLDHYYGSYLIEDLFVFIWEKKFLALQKPRMPIFKKWT